jgi:hypothetical protein
MKHRQTLSLTDECFESLHLSNQQFHVSRFFHFFLEDRVFIADSQAGQETANILTGLRLWKDASQEAAPGPNI